MEPYVRRSEVLLAYVRWAKDYYAESNELEHVKLALRLVKELYGRTQAAKFGPLALKAVRERMISDGLSRTGINKRIDRIKRVFRWAVENEMIPPTVYQGLQGRQIYLGPRAPAVLRPWLKTDLQAYLFSPAEAVVEQRAGKHRNRKTPLSSGNRPGSNRKRKPQRQAGEVYTVSAYRNAIKRGCKAADVPTWAPNRLRHNAATWLRKEFGLDVARVILGHRSPAVTEVYAEVDRQKAIEVMGKVG